MGARLDHPDHRAWLDAECRRLLAFGADVVHPAGGAAWLDTRGRADLARGVHTWITARMVHVHGLATLLDVPASRATAQRLLDGLTGPLRDPCHGGWFHHLAPDGVPEAAAGKSCYDHAFVLLAASSAALAGLDGATDLLADATEVFLDRFWDDEAGRCVDRWSADWRDLDPYRGLNANMHAVEAMLAVADATDDARWRERAARTCSWVVDLAREHAGRLPEHFDDAWQPLLDFNADRRDDPFKPYGATVGHGLEWARLLLTLEGTLPHPPDDGDSSPTGLLATATALFDRAVADGWAVDGAPGFVYTTDWSGRPVVSGRMHWVAAEAIAAAGALHHRTGDVRFADAYDRWWDHVADVFIDREGGSWWHELDARNHPVEGVWPGKPDLYHAVQATLLPRLPVAPTLARAIADGALT